MLPYEQKLLHTIAFDFSVSAPHLDAMIVIRDWWRKVDEMDNSKKNGKLGDELLFAHCEGKSY